MIHRTLTIAGSDSSGGAGIQADLKTFQELDTFGMSAITALTVQNTQGVHGVYPQPVEAVVEQMNAVLDDIGVDAVKTGMLFSADIIKAVSDRLRAYGVSNIVVDPVMIAKGGHRLLQEEAIEAIKQSLIPIATVITPNIPETEVLTGLERIENISDMKEAAKQLHALGAAHVLVKGGHLSDEGAIDVYYDGQTFTELSTARINTKHTHGTGCTYAAALCAELAKGKSPLNASRIAKEYITCAIRHSIRIGSGIGPTNHAAYRQKR